MVNATSNTRDYAIYIVPGKNKASESIHRGSGIKSN